MATIIAAVGGGNWTVGGTWVGGVAPTAADDAQLTVASGNVTIDTGAVARSLDCTGYIGTLTHGAIATLTLGDATAGAGNVALKFVAGMTYVRGNDITSAISFVSTSATQQTITTAGKNSGNVTISGVGSSYVLGDAHTIPVTTTFTLTAGTFNTGNFACSWGLFVISGAGNKTLTLGSSAIAITGNSGSSVNYTGSNLTVTANTAVMTFSGVSAGIQGATAFNWNGLSAVFSSSVSNVTVVGPTLNNLTFNGPANKTAQFFVVTFTLTVTGILTILGASAVNRIIVRSGTTGTAGIISVATSFALSNTDFMDITASGAAGTWTGTSMGNALGNTNITFDTPATQTHTASAGGNWSDVTKWTSRVPLPQDNVIVDVNTTGTLTADMPRLGADVDFTGFVGTASFASTANTIYGSINLASGMTVSGVQALTLSARSSKTITSNAKNFTQAVTITAPSGTYTLADAFSSSGFLTTQTAGTFLSASFSITAAGVSFLAGTTVTLGTSIVNTTSTTAAVVLVTFSTTCILSAASATFVVFNASANSRSMQLGNQTIGALTYTVAGSTGDLSFPINMGTVGTLNFSDASNARSLLLTAGSAMTILTSFNVFGTAGKLITIGSVTAAGHTLSKASGIVSCDYLSISRSTAQGGARWYAGINSTDGGNNSGWIFTGPPGNGAMLMLGVG